MRLAGYSMWEILVFLLNALLFVLIGLQLPRILDGLAGEPLGEAVTAAVVRLAGGDRAAAGCGCNVVIGLIRALDRRASQRARRSGAGGSA